MGRPVQRRAGMVDAAGWGHGWSAAGLGGGDGEAGGDGGCGRPQQGRCRRRVRPATMRQVAPAAAVDASGCEMIGWASSGEDRVEREGKQLKCMIKIFVSEFRGWDLRNTLEKGGI